MVTIPDNVHHALMVLGVWYSSALWRLSSSSKRRRSSGLYYKAMGIVRHDQILTGRN